jgi:hypothetical protein
LSTLHLFDGLALAWLGLNLLSSANVCLLITTAAQWQRVALALVTSGFLIALFGLIAWNQGQGVAVDGILRLAGPYYSPNQAALYLERTLWLPVGLALAATGWRRWGWWSSVFVMVVALLLTASRGAWFLCPRGWRFFNWLVTHLRHFISRQEDLDSHGESPCQAGKAL